MPLGMLPQRGGRTRAQKSEPQRKGKIAGALSKLKAGNLPDARPEQSKAGAAVLVLLLVAFATLPGGMHAVAKFAGRHGGSPVGMIAFCLAWGTIESSLLAVCGVALLGVGRREKVGLALLSKSLVGCGMLVLVWFFTERNLRPGGIASTLRFLFRIIYGW